MNKFIWGRFSGGYKVDKVTLNSYIGGRFSGDYKSGQSNPKFIHGGQVFLGNKVDKVTINTYIWGRFTGGYKVDKEALNSYIGTGFKGLQIKRTK